MVCLYARASVIVQIRLLKKSIKWILVKVKISWKSLTNRIETVTAELLYLIERKVKGWFYVEGVIAEHQK